MFGCCVAGRLLQVIYSSVILVWSIFDILIIFNFVSQTNLEQIDETHCAFSLENAEAINHICVFMLGTGEFRTLLLRSFPEFIDDVATNSSYRHASPIPTRIRCHSPFLLAWERSSIAGNVNTFANFHQLYFVI